MIINLKEFKVVSIYANKLTKLNYLMLRIINKALKKILHHSVRERETDKVMIYYNLYIRSKRRVGLCSPPGAK